VFVPGQSNLPEGNCSLTKRIFGSHRIARDPVGSAGDTVKVPVRVPVYLAITMLVKVGDFTDGEGGPCQAEVAGNIPASAAAPLIPQRIPVSVAAPVERVPYRWCRVKRSRRSHGALARCRCRRGWRWPRSMPLAADVEPLTSRVPSLIMVAW
jgi:hypothetical protein